MKAGTKYDEHLLDAFYENVAFLRSHGLSDEAIALRLGVVLPTFEKRMEREQ